MWKALFIISFLVSTLSQSQNTIHQSIDQRALELEPEIIQLRRHYHQFPELSNREFKTSEHIANQLNKLGLDVETGIAVTGVVGVLETGRPGPTIGLRADIDGLPVKERVPLDFASKEKAKFLGEDVGVMHACGHDTHIAMLLGAAHILTDLKDQLRGRIVFVFQPAEEGPPPGEEGGAELMIKEGLIEKYGIDVFFGQHILSTLDVGKIEYKLGGYMAAVDRFVIKVKGKQTHGARPWDGVDPITSSAQIIQGLNNIISRQTKLTEEAAVISVGKIKGGLRYNIIPEEVELIGTIRTLDTEMQTLIHEKIKMTATAIAQSSGATAEVKISKTTPVLANNLELTRRSVQSLFSAAGENNVHNVPARTGGEDFAFFANEVPAFFWHVGGKDPSRKAFPHHTPDFYIDESGLITGVKTMAYLAFDYLDSAD